MDFGFSLSPSSAVNLDTVDLSLFRKVEARCPDIRTCIGCLVHQLFGDLERTVVIDACFGYDQCVMCHFARIFKMAGLPE